MSDYISRDAAKEAFRKWTVDGDELGGVLQVVDAIPAADVRENRRGKWTREENWETGYGCWVNVCSACGAITPVNVSRYRYCPNCGADMRAEQT